MRRSVRMLMVGVLIAAGAVTTPPSTTAVHAGTTDAAAADHRWVTLVTGDRVLVRLTGSTFRVVTVDPGKGRDDITFRHRENHVLPSDAVRLVDSGRVDRRLFDVALLVRSEYDDRNRTTLPLILTGAVASGVPAAQRLASVGGGTTELKKTDATRFWTSVTGDGAARLAAAKSRIWLDGKVRAHLDRSVPQIGAPRAWKVGHTGRGVTVAVLDSGIDTGHPDLAGAVVGERNFTDSPTGTADRLGHGTHVAGIITASGGRYTGVAPDAGLLNGKVLADDGFGFESWVIAGMEWAVERGARVVNLSLAALFTSEEDPMAAAVDRLTDQSGTLFVVAAGNNGPKAGSVGSPGTADRALTVGAVDRDDVIAEFSGRGPAGPDGRLKPDVTAPGVGIVSTLAEGSEIAESEPAVDGRYVALSGTSMAAPHVAGAAALLAGEHQDWTATELKPVLMGTADPHDGTSVDAQGAGRIDVGEASDRSVFTTPPSLSAGVASWPHDDDRPVTTALTYHNDGDSALTLNLGTRVQDPAGNAAPDGMFRLSQSAVTVPAHGTATVDLVTDTRVTAPDGRYQGYVVATGGDTEIHTPVGLTREVESYDVTVRAIGLDGAAPTEFSASFSNVETGAYESSDGRTVRLPGGTYFLRSWVVTSARYVLAAEPSFVVDGAETLVIDSRDAQPIGFRLDRPGAELAGNVNIGFFRTTAEGMNSDEGIGRPSGFLVVPSRTSAPAGQFTYRVVGSTGRADGEGSFRDSPYAYAIEFKHDGNVPADLNPRLHDSAFARVEHTIAASAPDQQAWLGPVGPLSAPARIVELVTPGLEHWNAVGLFDGGDDPHTVLYALPKTYQPGAVTRLRWNSGVFGPGLAPHPQYAPFLVRHRDIIYAGIPLHGDQAADRIGWSATDEMRLALSKDGRLIGESVAAIDIFTVPDDTGTYRLEADAIRSNSRFTTRLSAAWTFTSSRASDTPLPVLAVRFAPSLDDGNRAPAGRTARYPVYVQQGGGASYGNLTKLTVDVSYDDGATWKPARVTGTGLNRTVAVDHPAGAQFVSLRAAAADEHGTAVTQTIIRAYGLR
ncbi:S8 family serine peptidase [Actinoplanes sp. NPDC051861]|uniref:S8 family serine peptidase n=1 Tax=Actinoplanes sp. NPDC051861 TaxID=3155170 RepID=UPI00341AF0DF